MAKSKLEKLREAIEDGKSFLSIIIVGGEVGQYQKVDHDEFESILETAEMIAQDESLEPIRYEAEIVVISEAKKNLQDSVVVLKEPVEISSKVLILKGTASQCIGSHTLHYKSGVINFRDGKAELPIELADELIEAGYVDAE
ncbi:MULTISPECIES: hypothetical protein [Paenibacillus]|uniref:hypothetical protein n=1 Tax=Paenibacillus TaxID=44249 RepID=UPI00096D04B2|nr:hypothetical protein [Paenibacillus odorifer]OME07559.1 hypothetical protein BSK60_30920 [Paenibacillus odorifer]